jgi:hypothetical protein
MVLKDGVRVNPVLLKDAKLEFVKMNGLII